MDLASILNAIAPPCVRCDDVFFDLNTWHTPPHSFSAWSRSFGMGSLPLRAILCLLDLSILFTWVDDTQDAVMPDQLRSQRFVSWPLSQLRVLDPVRWLFIGWRAVGSLLDLSINHLQLSWWYLHKKLWPCPTNSDRMVEGCAACPHLLDPG